MQRLTIDPLQILEVKYLDGTSGRALTIGDVIALKSKGVFNKSSYTSVNQLVSTQQYKPPVLASTHSMTVELAQGLGLEVFSLPKLPTPVSGLTTESMLTLAKFPVRLDTKNQYDLDYKSQNTPATYKPSYVNITADTTMMRIAAQTYAMMKFANSPISEYVDYTYNAMKAVAETHFYGNGSPLGQLNRLKAVNIVSAKAEKALRELQKVDPTLKMGVSDNELNVFLPIGERKAIRAPTLLDMFTNNSETDQPTMNRGSEEGAPFKPHVKREDAVLYEALTLAKIIAGDPDTNAQWPGMARMKPKAEVYEVKDLEKKTRNIYVLNAGQTSLLSMFVHHINKSVPDQPLSTTCRSLLKRPALTKMASEFAELVLTYNSSKVMCVTYSDNMFVVYNGKDGVRITSMDGSKMEGTNVSTTMLDNFVDYVLTKDEPLAPLIKKHGRRNINSVGQLGEVLLKVGGMQSGTPLTTMLNSYRMGLAAVCCEKEAATIEDVKRIVSLQGIDLTTERDYGIDELKELKINPTTLANVGAYVDADLLGFSIGAIKIGDKFEWVSILDPKRLIKSMVFNKVETSQRYKGPMLLVIRYITFTTLYIMGGWYYPGTASILKAACIDMVETLNDIGKQLPVSLATMHDIISSVVLELGIDQTTVDALVKSMLISTIPTLECVLKIVAPNISSADIIDEVKRLGLENEAHLLLEPQTFRDVGMVATPNQREYYSRHSVFRPRLLDQPVEPIIVAPMPSTDPQRSGTKRQRPTGFEKDEPAAKKTDFSIDAILKG